MDILTLIVLILAALVLYTLLTVVKIERDVEDQIRRYNVGEQSRNNAIHERLKKVELKLDSPESPKNSKK